MVIQVWSSDDQRDFKVEELLGKCMEQKSMVNQPSLESVKEIRMELQGSELKDRIQTENFLTLGLTPQLDQLLAKGEITNWNTDLKAELTEFRTTFIITLHRGVV